METEWFTAFPLCTAEVHVPGEPAAAAESTNQNMKKDNWTVLPSHLLQPEDQIESTCGPPDCISPVGKK